MDKSEKSKLEKVTQELMNSRTVRRLKHRYPFEVFPDGDGLIIRMELRDMNGEQVDLIDVPANLEGLVRSEAAYLLIVTAFEVGLETRPRWSKGMSR